MIRRLILPQDRATVFTLMEACADYVWLEREEPPLPYLVDEYFTDAPPGIDPAEGHRPGLFDGDRLLARAEMSFGYPAPDASYLGLMMVHPAARGTGGGPTSAPPSGDRSPQPGRGPTIACSVGGKPARPRVLGAGGISADRSCR